MSKSTRQTAFTLVEMVVVVVIIAIIATMAIPRLSKGLDRTDRTVTVGDLRIVREAINRYAVEHDNTFPGPDGETVAAQLTRYTNRAGDWSKLPGSAHMFGPYLVRIPPCRTGYFPGSSDIGIDDQNSPPQPKAGGLDAGWVYNPNTGEFFPNDVDYDDAGVTP